MITKIIILRAKRFIIRKFHGAATRSDLYRCFTTVQYYSKVLHSAVTQMELSGGILVLAVDSKIMTENI